MGEIWELLKATYEEWSDDGASRWAAALAFYTAISLAPIFILVLMIAGFVFGQGTAETALINQLQALLGDRGADFIAGIVERVDQPNLTSVAGIISVATLIFGATGAFVQLQDALNAIWDVDPDADGGIEGTIQQRFVSFAMIAAIAFLLLVSLIISAALSAVNSYLSQLLPGLDAAWFIVNITVTIGVVTLLFALIYKVIPDVEIGWGDVWLGALVTAVLFTIGKFLIGLYLGTRSLGSTYGAAGSLVVILLWVFYSAQIFFVGAEFTQVYAERYGSGIEPEHTSARLEHGTP